MKASKLLSALYSALLAVFWFALAVAVPLLCRPYYYLMARLLHLSEKTGFSTEVIHEAYNDVMDYLLLGAPFATGQLKWSESGMSHFADCIPLFRGALIALAVSALLLAVSAVLLRQDKLHLHHFCGRNPAAIAAAAVTLLGLVLGIWALIDFWSLFTFFHAVCFPGKTNWLFSYRTDEIILILPEAFWAITGTLVVAIAVGGLWLTARLWRCGRQK